MTCSEKREPKGSGDSSTERKKCGYSEHGFKPFQGYRDEPGKPHCLTCGHAWGECNWHWVKGDPPFEEPRCEGCGHTEGEGCGCPPKCRHCFDHTDSRCCHCDALDPNVEPEPPLTPEEEEQAPEDEPRCTCGDTACESELCDCDSAPCSVDHAREAPEDFGECPGFPECPGQGNCPACSAPEEEPPPQPERRPPYAVAYSVQGGHLYEVALPGDATVKAVDGALVIQHHLGPVAGIVQVLPVINKEEQG